MSWGASINIMLNGQQPKDKIEARPAHPPADDHCLLWDTTCSSHRCGRAPDSASLIRHVVLVDETEPLSCHPYPKG